MEKIETIDDFRRFVERNRDLIREKSVEVSDLPEDDDWINDDGWDEKACNCPNPKSTPILPQ